MLDLIASRSSRSKLGLYLRRPILVAFCFFCRFGAFLSHESDQSLSPQKNTPVKTTLIQRVFDFCLFVLFCFVCFVCFVMIAGGWEKRLLKPKNFPKIMHMIMTWGECFCWDCHETQIGDNFFSIKIARRSGYDSTQSECFWSLALSSTDLARCEQHRSGPGWRGEVWLYTLVIWCLADLKLKGQKKALRVWYRRW